MTHPCHHRRSRRHGRTCRRRSRRLFAPTIFHDFSVTAPWKPKSLTTSSLVDFLRNSRHLWDEAMGPTVTDQRREANMIFQMCLLGREHLIHSLFLITHSCCWKGVVLKGKRT